MDAKEVVAGASLRMMLSCVVLGRGVEETTGLRLINLRALHCLGLWSGGLCPLTPTVHRAASSHFAVGDEMKAGHGGVFRPSTLNHRNLDVICFKLLLKLVIYCRCRVGNLSVFRSLDHTTCWAWAPLFNSCVHSISARASIAATQIHHWF